ncbi:NAD(P)-binding domain-containing protein [Planosporangium flavigriseum]|uniref:Flavin-binding monooxygenase n=1 Tax=Planosporangium flavigriseum TaxID=373681 RepID=A0A8J3LIV6_9ACTN|nr:NAD(P)-binding domain-containing protein [Planosporangium flavigriseum]NJC63273.1 NAD(P)-binding domain-containing protein [Planosporangium flavigriseum]GIG72547.1 flavin-binding monooxygenase [Planosporangium flavigriseum]
MDDQYTVRPDTAASAARVWHDGQPVYDRGDTVCVIGAGGSGLTVIKNLREAGFSVDCYERETSVGGAWNWRHDRSPVYASTHLISSKPFTQFPDFPMPDDWPDYPHHSQMLTYFERYADHFGLREHVWFGTEVARVEPLRDGRRWDVTVRGSRGGQERTLRYAAVVVANGHNWSPRYPEIEGLDDFRGQVLHASAYSDAAQLRGRKVLVIGGGNTGCDLAVEAAQQATRCWHSTRRGYWYAPKYVLGRPADQANDLLRWLRLPLALRRWLFTRLLRLTVGDFSRLGLREPDHKPYESHPVVNSQLMYYIGHGVITPVPDVARFTRGGVEFADGTSADPDLVVLATGYQPVFEFASPELLGIDADGRPRLRLQLFSRTHPTLAVVGLVQPGSGMFSIAHWQAVTVARWLRRWGADPERAAAAWGRRQGKPERRFVQGRVADSSRHWFEVDHVVYLRALQRSLDELEAA